MDDDILLGLTRLFEMQSQVTENLCITVKNHQLSLDHINKHIVDLKTGYLRLTENAKTTPIPGKVPNCS
jgi:hypothetical protein